MPAFAVFFLTGILLIQQLKQLPTWPELAMAFFFALFCAGFRYWRLVFFIGGILWASVFALNRLADRLPTNLAGQELTINGTIISLPEQNQDRASFNFQPDTQFKKLPSKIRLSWYKPSQNLKAGQHWQFTVKLKSPHGMLNPGGFDYETWAFMQGIGATGYVRKPEPRLLGTSNDLYSIDLWRQAISEQLNRLVPNSESLALIKALSIGDGGEIKDSQWQVFRKTGTIHLIVISGSHISLIAGFIFFLVQKLWTRTGILRFSPPTVAACCALGSAFFYTGLAGFSVPSERALIMVAVAMLGIIWQRHIKLLNTLALALLAVLLFDPLSVLAPGFWLSFLAVFFILYCQAKRLGKPSWLFAAVQVHIVLTLALAPVLLYFFQQMSLISPIANFIAVPVIELLAVPLILLSLGFIFWQPWLAGKLLFLISQVLNGLYSVLERLANFPLATFNYPQPDFWGVLLSILGMLLLFAPRGIPARGLSVLLCLPLMLTKADTLETAEFNLTLLDVGQGLSVVVQTSNHLLVFDTGAKTSSDFDMGKAVVLPFLRNLSATRVDSLVISHGDNDHIGGADSILVEMPTTSIYSSVPQLLSPHPAKACLAGQQWQWDGVIFTMLSPSNNSLNNENNDSCVLKISSRYGSVLLTGDIEAPAEQELVLNSAAQLPAEILIAPHHGSKTSSTGAFLSAVNPKLILIPAGFQNRYRFPHQSVIQRYQTQKRQWQMTGMSGAITVTMSKSGWRSFSYRQEFGKYWYDR